MTPSTPTIPLGALVRDSITGFAGILTARSVWLHGCIRCGVESGDLRDGKPIEPQWFDEPRIECIGSTNFAPSAMATGGDRPDAGRAPDGKR